MGILPLLQTDGWLMYTNPSFNFQFYKNNKKKILFMQSVLSNEFLRSAQLVALFLFLIAINKSTATQGKLRNGRSL